MKMPSVMSAGNRFAQVPRAEIPRSSFDRSHGVKTTFDAGVLIPVYLDEALPGDTFNLSMSMFARLATPLKPLMDNMYLESFFFAVPIRLLWENWHKFNGAQDTPGDSTDFTIPQVIVPDLGYAPGYMEDYFGLPLEIAPNGWSHSALPRRAYYRIYNEWFRDQNLINSEGVGLETDDGPDLVFDPGSSPGFSGLKKRGKRHDYFTGCLPWPQKGEAVSIPLGTSAPVVGAGNDIPTFWDGTSGTSVLTAESAGTQNIGVEMDGSTNWTPGENLRWQEPSLEADLTEATAATINSLRQAFQVQRLLERDARGGTRYTEIVKAHFGVTSPDARLQRPEYLGGGSTPVHISPIAQTAPTDEVTPQGNLAAIGTATGTGHGFVKSFTEHCILLGLVCVRADLTYQQGVERMWSRETRFDFYWPALAHIGEQAVLNKEIYFQGSAEDEDVFGYQERYAEYRYKPSRITGKFRSDVADSLDIWHLSQDFGSLPTLSQAFIEENPPLDRVIATPEEPHFIFDSYIRLKCARPMPVYGVPGLIDHF